MDEEVATRQSPDASPMEKEDSTPLAFLLSVSIVVQATTVVEASQFISPRYFAMDSKSSDLLLIRSSRGIWILGRVG